MSLINHDQTQVEPHYPPALPAPKPKPELPPPRPPKRSGLFKWVVTIAILIVITLIAIYLYRKHEEVKRAAAARQQGPPAVTVTSANAKRGNIGVYLDEIGIVTPVYTVSITSQVNGQISQVHYQEGQLIEKGDSLVDIDPRPFEATLMQAQGTLHRDQNVLGQAQMDLERYRTAWARNAIQKQQLDDQEKLVLQDQGTVENDQGVVNYDQIQVGYCHITSPIDGRVGLRLVDPGNVVQANSTTPLVVVTQISPITVVFTLAEDDIGTVASHVDGDKKLHVNAFDRGGKTKLASGELITLDNQIDTTTGTVRARAQFPNEDLRLFPNEFVNIRLLVTMLKGVTLIPTSAIQHSEQASFVYVIENGTAHMKSVTTGTTDGAITEVKGINTGDVLANSGFESLQDGAKVTIASNSTTQPSATTQLAPSAQP